MKFSVGSMRQIFHFATILLGKVKIGFSRNLGAKMAPPSGKTFFSIEAIDK